MKAVLLLAVLTVFVLLPEDGDAWFIRNPWQRFKNKVKSGFQKVKSGFRTVKEKIGSKWRQAKQKLIKKLQDRRELDDYDLNQDGALDQAELETMIGERHARDLWELMNADDSVTFDQFERNVRQLDELEEEDE